MDVAGPPFDTRGVQSMEDASLARARCWLLAAGAVAPPWWHCIPVEVSPSFSPPRRIRQPCRGCSEEAARATSLGDGGRPEEARNKANGDGGCRLSFRSLSRCFRNDDFEIVRQGGSGGARKETNGDGTNVATRMAEAEGDGRTERKGEGRECGGDDEQWWVASWMVDVVDCFRIQKKSS